MISQLFLEFKDLFFQVIRIWNLTPEPTPPLPEYTIIILHIVLFRIQLHE